jgi:hypothetical protein
MADKKLDAVLDTVRGTSDGKSLLASLDGRLAFAFGESATAGASYNVKTNTIVINPKAQGPELKKDVMWALREAKQVLRPKPLEA